ncbi:MAG: 2-oxoacid:acceptor oxidoreductase subunit alpha [Bacteroidales bacterium]|jgi:2-oxoglutarate ferredoxin oxidoreductase subunit alpha|nr:2-oxoacid:acceptor oxidoreductase subunit alpha [Bacteroidales bacterium]
MENKNHKIIELEHVVVKLAGDSGDGMQLSGSQFSDTTAIEGHDLATFPDYPAEIRAPQGTVAGVSGFQLHFGHINIQTPGDLADVLIALNPAALKVNMKWVKPGAIIIVDADSFEPKDIEKAGYQENPLEDGTLSGYKVIKAPITSLSRTTCIEIGLDAKSADRAKNQFALGMLYYMFHKDIDLGAKFLEEKFAKKELVASANKAVLEAGYHFAENLQEFDITYRIKPSADIKGRYRSINGNVAAAWGLMAAAEKSGLELFLGSYPITPATEILQELAHHKQLGVKTLQAEDEIAGINSAIGAAFAGKLAATSTSGPGLALKSEAIGLAVITELPLVIIDVQRGGPSTGLPTKPEQADLMQALFGRNGESPVVVMAASTPANCFDYAFMAAKIAVEHMVPVILLTDGYLANGSELWKIPKMINLPVITPCHVKDNDPEYMPYKRDPRTLSRPWAIPGQEGLRHRIGGLEKEDVIGTVSHDPLNHQKMVSLRQDKVYRVAEVIPDLEVYGEHTGDLLVVGWGGTYGHLISAVKDLQSSGEKVSLAHFNYIYPMPKNTEEVLKGFKKIIVCELNNGQFIYWLRARFPQYQYLTYHKVQGLPFLINELKMKFHDILKEH